MRILAVTFSVALAALGTTQTLAAETDALKPGKELAFSPDKGNCLACHVMDDAETGGDLGPPLLYMSARYPDLNSLIELIADARRNNPDSAMPPYGTHRILDSREIKAIAEYVHSL